jgi:hypothetical protein
MRISIVTAVIALDLLIGSSSQARSGSIAEMPLAASEGKWELRVGKDKFSDENNCVTIPKGNPRVQVNLGKLFVSYRGRGGVQSYRIRLDDGPPSALRLASSIERKAGHILLGGGVFERILMARRLRVQALTTRSGVVVDDLDLSGMAALYKRMQSICGGKGTP